MELPLGDRNTDSHESLSLSPAGRTTMEMDILEGFSLALLTQLNVYNIITKGKKNMFSGKKSTTQTEKYVTEPKQTTHISANYLWWNWLFCSSRTGDRVVYVHKSRILPRSLIFNLRESNRKSFCLLKRALT